MNNTTTENETTGAIRTAMARMGLTQSEMAAYLGVPQSTLCNWLAGTRNPPRVATRLMYVLGIVQALAPGIHDSLLPRK